MPTPKHKYVPHFLLFFVLCASLARAGSFYSRYGYGLLRSHDGVKATAMGGVGIAITDSVSIFYLNPASLATFNTTHIQGEFLYDRANLTLGDTRAKFHDSNVNGLGILLPVKRGYSVAFGIQPYSQVDYEFSDKVESGDKPYTQSLLGSGGLDNFYFAFGGTAGPLRLGVASDFYFGLVRRTWRVNFVPANLVDTEDQTSTHFKGIGFHGGLQTTIKRWQLGVALGAPVTLNAETQQEFVFSSIDSTPLPPMQFDARLPFWYGLSAAYQAGPKWLFAAQYRMQQWSDLNTTELLGANGVDSYNFGFGLQFTPSFDRLQGNIGRIHYRAGATLSRLPYAETNGKTVSEWTATAGFGLPFNRGDSRLDFAFEFGKRGSADNLSEEKIFRFSASVIGSERWFQRSGKR